MFNIGIMFFFFSVVGFAGIVDLELLAQVYLHVGTPTIRCAIPATSRGIKDILAHFVIVRIARTLTERWFSALCVGSTDHFLYIFLSRLEPVFYILF